MICKLSIPAGAILAAAFSLGLAGCSDPEPDPSPLEQAEKALAEGEGLAAEVILRDMLAAGADRTALAAYLGEAELQQGQLAEARQWLGDGAFSEDMRGHGFHMLARLEMQEGNLPSAGQAFDQALKYQPESAELWVDIGRLRYRGGEQVQAVDASIYAVELDPENAEALRFRAQLVRDAEGMREAIPWFERALERNPENVDLMLDYAATLGELGRVKDMLSVIREVSRIDVGNKRVYFLQAVLAARAGNYDLAGLLLLRSSRADQEMPAAMLLSGIIDLENGNYASAAQTLERLAGRQPDNRRVRQLLARALSLGQNDRELIYRFAGTAQQPSASPYLRMLVARSYEALGDREKAGPMLDLAALPRGRNLVAVPAGSDLNVAEARGGATGSAALGLIRARISAGQAAGAPAVAEQLLRNLRGSADALALAGDANMAARKYRAAINRYTQFGTVRKPWLITRKLVTALEASGRDSEALAVLARYFVGDPGNTEAAASLAREAYMRDDYTSAAIFADHALTNGGMRDPVLHAMRAEIAIKMGETELAVKMAKRAYALQPMSEVTTNVLANVFRDIGGHDQKVDTLTAKAAKLPA
ncbi:tetratricopeptide repeat protein [Pontixanthobacter sp.]|uniref:tetratricopeptide repeat protein n=1 Tax=Pontixanthobacter sp. TaxID=2792078 RepID=UPI003C7B24E2